MSHFAWTRCFLTSNCETIPIFISVTARHSSDDTFIWQLYSVFCYIYLWPLMTSSLQNVLCFHLLISDRPPWQSDSSFYSSIICANETRPLMEQNKQRYVAIWEPQLDHCSNFTSVMNRWHADSNKPRERNKNMKPFLHELDCLSPYCFLHVCVFIFLLIKLWPPWTELGISSIQKQQRKQHNYIKLGLTKCNTVKHLQYITFVMNPPSVWWGCTKYAGNGSVLMKNY